MKRFWEHYPKKYWQEEDWQAWEKAGRPKVPKHVELPSPFEQKLGDTPLVTPRPGPRSCITSLYEKPRGKSRGARSDAIDVLLDKVLGR